MHCGYCAVQISALFMPKHLRNGIPVRKALTGTVSVPPVGVVMLRGDIRLVSRIGAREGRLTAELQEKLNIALRLHWDL